MDCSMSVARWSRGMICASDARGPGFKSRTSPIFHSYYQKNGENLNSNTLNKAQLSLKTSLKHADDQKLTKVCQTS